MLAKNRLEIIVLILTSFVIFIVHLNIQQLQIKRFHVDEWYTFNFAIDQMLDRYEPGNDARLAVGETTRYFTKLIFPFGVYYMNTKMGGELHHITSFEYPGAHYLRDHFKNPEDIEKDPNIQDFVYASRVIFGGLVLLTTLIVSYFILINFSFISALCFLILSMLSHTLIDSIVIFYTETSLTILFNLLLILIFLKNVSDFKRLIWASVIFSLACYTKLTGVLFIVPMIYFLRMIKVKHKIEIFILLFLVLTYFINLPSKNLLHLVHYMLANVYHYKTGHEITDIAGWGQIKKIAHWLYPYLYLWIPSLFLIKFNPNKRAFYSMLAIMITLLILPLINNNLFFPRNLNTTNHIIVLFLALMLGELHKLFINQNKNIAIKKYSFFIITLILMTYLFSKAFRIYQPIKTENFTEQIQACTNTAVVGTEKIPGVDVLPSMPETFFLRDDLHKFNQLYLPYQCIIIRNTGNNKHLTNYIFPQHYKIAERQGELFLFIKK